MTRRVSAFTAVLVASLLVWSPSVVSAAVEIDFQKPDVSYSGTRIMTAEQGEVRHKFYYAPQKTRSEMDQEGMSFVTITREDLGVIWMILGEGMYMESSMDDLESYGQGVQDSTDTMEVVEFVEIGDEDVDGYDTTKYRVVARDKRGEQMTGHYWITEERIPVRMEMDFQMEEGPTHVIVRIEDLSIGDHPDSLFEVPAGYNKLDRSMMPDFGNRGFGERMKDSAAEGATRGAEQGVQEESQNRVKEGVKKGLKKLFGG